MVEKRVSMQERLKYHPDGWGEIQITQATLKRMDECQKAFKEYADPLNGYFANWDDFLTFAMLKLLDYRQAEEAARVRPATSIVNETLDKPSPRRSWLPAAVSAAVHLRDGGKCTKCESTERLDVHHKIPRFEGGGDELDNLALLCRACHKQVHIDRGDAGAARLLAT